MKAYKVLSILFMVSAMVILSSCATSSDRYPSGEVDTTDYSANSNAAPEAYGMEGFFVRKAAPKHEESQPIDFFFKHCTGSMSRVWYSKTSYECERP